MTQKLLHNLLLGYEDENGISLSRSLTKELQVLGLKAKPGVFYRGGLLTSSSDPAVTLAIVTKYLHSVFTDRTATLLAHVDKAKANYRNYSYHLVHKEKWQEACVQLLANQIGYDSLSALFHCVNKKYHNKIYSLTKLLKVKQ